MKMASFTWRTHHRRCSDRNRDQHASLFLCSLHISNLQRGTICQTIILYSIGVTWLTKGDNLSHYRALFHWSYLTYNDNCDLITFLGCIMCVSCIFHHIIFISLLICSVFCKILLAVIYLLNVFCKSHGIKHAIVNFLWKKIIDNIWLYLHSVV